MVDFHIDASYYTYTAYGLHLRSAFALPELQEARELSEQDPDVVLRQGVVARVPEEEEKEYGFAHITPQEAYFVFRGVGSLLVREGCELIFEPMAGVAPEIAQRMMLGIAMGVLLYQRGVLVLHASAVQIGDEVVAFAGNKGWGKSTFAATLHGRGHTLVADDAVAVELTNGRRPTVLAGIPQFKLWPDAAAASLGENPESLPKLHPLLEKRARRVPEEDFMQTAHPLRAVFVLGVGDELSIEPVARTEAFVELVRHSFAVRILEMMGAASTHFFQCTTLARQVPVYRLVRPSGLDLLAETAELVETLIQSRGS